MENPELQAALAIVAVVQFLLGQLANFFQVEEKDKPWKKFAKKTINILANNWSNKAGK